MEPVTLTVNLTEAIADLQLGICDEQIEVIANDIKRGWDFTHIYEEIEVGGTPQGSIRFQRDKLPPTNAKISVEYNISYEPDQEFVCGGEE